VLQHPAYVMWKLISLQDLSSDGGVKKMIKCEGVGPVVPKGARIKVHYNGWVRLSWLLFITRYWPKSWRLKEGKSFNDFDPHFSSFKYAFEIWYYVDHALVEVGGECTNVHERNFYKQNWQVCPMLFAK